MLAEYMQEERRGFRLGTDTKLKGAKTTSWTVGA